MKYEATFEEVILSKEQSDKLIWHKWEGGENPVKIDEGFAVRFKNQDAFEAVYGPEVRIAPSVVADLLYWEHKDAPVDIVEYAVVRVGSEL